jgi:hypothetical protein
MLIALVQMNYLISEKFPLLFLGLQHMQQCHFSCFDPNEWCVNNSFESTTSHSPGLYLITRLVISSFLHLICKSPAAHLFFLFYSIFYSFLPLTLKSII